MEARSAGDPDIAVRCFRSPANLERLDRAHRLAAEKGVSVPQIAAAYALNYPLNIFALIGAMDAEECRANVAALDLHLTEAEMAWLDLRAE
jgi:aryl-alcohol dehydrogenase-like predicted oxidoreductase